MWKRRNHNPWSSEDVEGVCKMGPEEADRSWSGATRQYISRDSRCLWVWPCQVCAADYYLGRNVGSPLGPREQSWVNAVETCFFPSPKEVQYSTLFWETHGDHFLGSKGLLLIDYLPPKTMMNGQYYASLLLKLHDAIKEKRRGMPIADARSLAVARQRSNSQVHDCIAGCLRLRLRTVRPPCIQFWPGSQWPFSVPQSEVSPSWCPLSWWWSAQGSCQGVAGGTDRRFLFYWN